MYCEENDGFGEEKEKKEKGCGEIMWCRGSIAGKEA